MNTLIYLLLCVLITIVIVISIWGGVCLLGIIFHYIDDNFPVLSDWLVPICWFLFLIIMFIVTNSI